MENSSSRDESFPAGLRVLVVDDDPTWLKILEKMLRKCSYEVTTCSLARVALGLLRERKDWFDIVISDVNMPDMDGFKLLEQVGLEMDLPVIMMSVDGETSRVMKGVQHGACDYLLKPVRMKELRNIWQHVFRKKIHEVKETENYDSYEDNNIRSRLDEFNGGFHPSKKRKDNHHKEYMEQSFGDSVSVKKARVVWSVDLHQKFVTAVNQIGFDKVGPKKILDLMDVPGLTRENVASHLQKYRLYLSRLQKQNEEKTLGGAAQTELNVKERPGVLSQQSSLARQQQNSPSGFGFSSARIYTQEMIPKIASFRATETELALNDESWASLNKRNITRFGVMASKNLEPWGDGGNQLTQFVQFMKDQQSITFKDFLEFRQAGQDHCFETDHPQSQPIVNLRGSTEAEDTSQQIHMKPVDSKESKYMLLKCGLDSGSSQVSHGFVNTRSFQAASATNLSCGNPCSSDDKNSITSWSSLYSDAEVAPSIDSLTFPLQSCGFFENAGFHGLGAFECNQIASDFQSILYDELQYNCEYLSDLFEAPMVDDGLFT
ncbi:unnamed protein product [Spirodela intermedia]|uniref:Two-component response regulator n=1 Tax=Spirodela intermedia TaxID=51605 RepID=A0A7I8KDX4_SPIIN|nr:unnamed protein product [Spirodela intermedia]